MKNSKATIVILFEHLMNIRFFIMKELWGPQSRGTNQILRVNMANIRRKIEHNPAEPKYIFTEVGVGYRMIEPDA